VYDTEKEVGEGIQAKVDDGTIKDKSEIFITTKVITNIKKKQLSSSSGRRMV
jgi:diketogulonate reductase-like aldo/keto reductase